MYNKYVEVDKGFKSSVNLQYDLYNEDKISHYIPTTDLCDVIKKYAISILNGENRSTYLSGPYGKGKSYLLLMISFLFGKHDNKKLYNNVIQKIRLIDKELSDMLIEINNHNYSFLTVVVDGNGTDDVNQNFLIALNTSLKANGIVDIVPKTSYLECLKLIDSWKNSKDDSFDILSKCLDQTKIALDVLEQGLKNYDNAAYQKFLDLFHCVSHGYHFNPLVSNDIGSIFDDVGKQIADYGYNGILTIFDEFGAFLENQTADFSVKLNKIQAFAEKCNNSSQDNQLHFCCIAHKNLELYQNKDKQYSDDFGKIAGRFKAIRFDRSLEENYQIICGAIKKNLGYDNIVNNAINTQKNLIESIKNSGIFYSASEVDYLFSNAYPLNPVAVYALNKVSEKVAQNERTLFTYISDIDVNSFNYFINNNDYGLLNVPSIYGYFEDLIHGNEDYKEIYYKVSSLVKNELMEEMHDLFKAIAIFKIIDDDLKCPCSIHNIAISLNKSELEVHKLVNIAIEKNYLKRSILNNTIDFAVISDKTLNDIIDGEVIKKYSQFRTSDLLNMFDKNIFHVSSRYNFENKMIRFMKGIYLETSVLKLISNTNSLFSGEYCDGYVINLINDDSSNIEEVEKKLDELNAGNIIVRYVYTPISKDVVNKLCKYFASYNLLNNDKLNENERNLLPEYVSDLFDELQTYLKDLYEKSISLSSSHNKKKLLSDLIFIVLSAYYSQTFVLNNDQVNKESISVISAKARDIVVESLLQNKEANFGTTSAEATIKRSFEIALDNNHNPDLVKSIRSMILRSNGSVIPFSSITSFLSNRPYGVRKGIMPLLIAKAIQTITITEEQCVQTVVLFNGDTEIPLNSANLSKAVANSSKYSICYETVNNEKLSMVKELAKIFNCDQFDSYDLISNKLVQKIKYKISNLEPVIIKSNEKDNILNLSKEGLEFKNLLLSRDINNHDLLFNKLPNIFDTSVSKLSEKVQELLKEYEEKVDNLYVNNIEKVKKLLGFKTETIKNSYMLWCSQYLYLNSIVFNDSKLKRIKNAFDNILFEDRDSINAIAFAAINSTLDDWNAKKNAQLEECLKEYVNIVAGYKALDIKEDELTLDDETYNLSTLGNTLFSNLLDSIDEYGNSISNEEKINILKKIIKTIKN